jgi:RNA polymerase sigma factor (TIGR02999 family)
MADLTPLLDAAARGDRRAAAELLPLVYAELRRLAAARLAHEKPGHTLDATALVHEAYLRLVASPGREPGEAAHFANQGHFFAAAAEAMRRILVDHARRKARPKHGGDRQRHDVAALEPAAPAPADALDLLALDEVLTRFEAVAPRKAHLVKLRYFAGCTLPEAADHLGIALSTAEADWTFAKAWLKRELGKS